MHALSARQRAANDIAMHRMRTASRRFGGRHRLKRAERGGARRPGKCGENTETYIESRTFAGRCAQLRKGDGRLARESQSEHRNMPRDEDGEEKGTKALA